MYLEGGACSLSHEAGVSASKITVRNSLVTRAMDSEFTRGINTNTRLLFVEYFNDVETCRHLRCEDCPVWPMCHIGELPLGRYTHVYLDSYHLKKSIGWRGGEVLAEEGTHISSLSFHIAADNPKQPWTPITSKHKHIFFPEMEKDEKGNPTGVPDV